MLTPKQKIELVIQRGYYTKDGILYKNNKEVKGCIDPLGYHKFGTSHNGKMFIIRTHRLVGYQKYGDVIFNKNIILRNLDNNKSNFKESNISIGNHKDNYHDTPISLRTFIGGKSGLTTENVSYIKSNHIRNGGTLTTKQLAQMFNRHITGINRIIDNTYYKNY